MAKKSTFGNMVLVLSGICLVCSALLGTVYAVTKAPIEASELAKVNAAISAVTPAFDNIPSEDVRTLDDGAQIYTSRMGGQVVGYAIKVSTSGFGGPLTIMVGFTPDGTVYNTSVISHSETPGLGAKAGEWFQQGNKGDIIGKNPATPLSVKKDGGEVDAISGSTITSRAFCEAINNAYNTFQGIEK